MRLLVAVLCCSCLAFAQNQATDAGQSKSTSTHHKKSSKPGPSNGSCGTHCGTERWALKTLTDGDGASLKGATPNEKKVTDLITQHAPSKLPATRRVPFEKQLVKVHALLIGWKVESEAHGDKDFHIVIADPADHSKQMIVEVPSPECQGVCSSIFLENFKNNRQTVQDKLGQPAPQFQSLNKAWEVDIVGPPFFDFNHGQIGLAPNCIEIHPVVEITFGNQIDQAIRANAANTIAHRCGTPANGGGGQKKAPGTGL